LYAGLWKARWPALNSSLPLAYNYHAQPMQTNSHCHREISKGYITLSNQIFVSQKYSKRPRMVTRKTVTVVEARQAES
jgi:hypothetical protein